MTRWQAFEAVCGHLRSGLLGDGRPGAHPVAPWDLLADLGSRHNVLPALAWCMKEADLPADLHGYFDAVVERNGARNARLIAGLERAAGALNGVGIEPVPLKGAAHIISDIYPAAGLRVMSDLDVLVPEDRARQAADALAAAGFRVWGMPVPDNHLHLPPMYDQGGDVQVELHTRVEHDPARGILPAVWFAGSTHPARLRGTHIRLPDATAAVCHNIVHSQLDHEFDRLNRVELRQLLDLALLRSRHENRIDWVEIDRRFTAAGFARTLATYLEFAEVVFGQPMPKLTGLPRPEFFMLVRAGVQRPERPRRRAAAVRGLRQVRARLVHRPAGAVEQVNNSTEAGLIRGWAADMVAKGPARSVQIFVNGRHKAAVVPRGDRQDVAANSDVPGLSACGFEIAIQPPIGPQDRLQVFAELRGDVFAELPQLSAQDRKHDPAPVAEDALRRLTAEIADRDRRLTEADGEMRRLIAEVGERDRRLKQADAEMQQLIADRANGDRRLLEADAELRRLIAELGDRDRRLTDAKGELQRILAGLEDRDRRLAGAAAELQQLIADAHGREQRLSYADAELRRLIAELDDRDRRLMEADAELRRLIAELGDRHRRLVEADAELRRLIAELGDRDRRLVEADAELRQLIAGLGDRDRRLMEVDAELRQLIAELGDRDRRLMEVDAELRQLIAGLGDRDRRLLEAHTELTRLIAEAGERDGRLRQVDADLRRLFTELGERDGRLADADAVVRGLRAQVRERDQQLATADADVRRLTAELADCHRQLTERQWGPRVRRIWQSLGGYRPRPPSDIG